MSLIYITEHGVLRARQRCGWPETALQRMLDRIVAFGASPAKCPPAVAQWLEDLSGLHPRREFRVYGNHVFVFQPEDELPGRNEAFRRRVIELYDYQCVACGLRIWLPEHELTFVDAAHLVPFSETRNDHPTNGLALCKNHHWALDQRLIAPDSTRVWHVSRQVESRRSRGEEELARLAGQPLLAPVESDFAPDPLGLEWRFERLLA